MIYEVEHHEWQHRIVARFGNDWKAFYSNTDCVAYSLGYGDAPTEHFIQRRRKRDHLDPTPCEGIEHPIWRDWEASPDAEIQAVLVRKGMPFRSLEK